MPKKSTFELWLAGQIEAGRLKLNSAPRILMSVAYRAGYYQGNLDAKTKPKKKSKEVLVKKTGKSASEDDKEKLPSFMDDHSVLIYKE